MKKIVFIILVSLFSIVSSQNATGSTCSDLWEAGLEYEKMTNGLRYKIDMSSYFLGFTDSAATMTNYLWKAVMKRKGLPEEAQLNQLALIYIKYLKENPEKHHESSMTCFMDAMSSAFPQW